jgi:diacylglycerol O-acyltransferase / wax synthase
MKNPVPKRVLSAADAAFLYLERKEMPLGIASVSVFDGPIPFDEFVASIASKLHLAPRYRQIAVMPPWNLGLPTWEDDPHFNIRRHIFRVSLDRPGGEAELEALAGRILSQLLDRSKPLWDIHVVDGLKGGRGALIWRLHHALADGISGTRLMEVMLDTTPGGSRALRKPRHRAPPSHSSDHSLADGTSSGTLSTLKSLIAVEEGLLGFAQVLLSDEMRNGLKGLLSLLPEFTASVERLPFNKPCSGDRKFCWAEFDFADVQAVREAVGGKVNDVVLTVLTRALARYVKLHGQTVVNRFVRIVCPVSLRRGDQQNSLGNQISFLPVALPMDVRNPVQMLQAVTSRTERMKRGGAAYLVALAAGCIAAAPAALQALFWRGLTEVTLPVPLFNMICTDVPGPTVPLFAAGRRMMTCYPQVPTGYDLGVNCAVQSYDGKLFFGLIADAHIAPDVNRLRDFLYDSFRELCHAAGVKKAQSGGGTTRTARTRRSKAARPVRVPAPKLATEAPPAATPAPLVTNAKDAAQPAPGRAEQGL